MHELFSLSLLLRSHRAHDRLSFRDYPVSVDLLNKETVQQVDWTMKRDRS